MKLNDTEFPSAPARSDDHRNRQASPDDQGNVNERFSDQASLGQLLSSDRTPVWPRIFPGL